MTLHYDQLVKDRAEFTAWAFCPHCLAREVHGWRLPKPPPPPPRPKEPRAQPLADMYQRLSATTDAQRAELDMAKIRAEKAHELAMKRYFSRVRKWNADHPGTVVKTWDGEVIREIPSEPFPEARPHGEDRFSVIRQCNQCKYEWGQR